MADAYLAEPISKSEAYVRAFNVRPGTQLKSVRESASRAFKKPQVLAYLAKYSDKAERDLVEVTEYAKNYGSQGGRDGASYAAVASSNLNSILDRIHGKARQTTDINIQSTNITIDLSGGEYGAPPQEMLQPNNTNQQ